MYRDEEDCSYDLGIIVLTYALNLELYTLISKPETPSPTRARPTRNPGAPSYLEAPVLVSRCVFFCLSFRVHSFRVLGFRV